VGPRSIFESSLAHLLLRGPHESCASKQRLIAFKSSSASETKAPSPLLAHCVILTSPDTLLPPRRSLRPSASAIQPPISSFSFARPSRVPSSRPSPPPARLPPPAVAIASAPGKRSAGRPVATAAPAPAEWPSPTPPTAATGALARGCWPCVT